MTLDTFGAMRILVCASEAPLPPLNGFRLQLIPVCNELVKRGHDIFVLAYHRIGQEADGSTPFELRLLDYPERGRVRSAASWLTRGEPLGAINAHRRMADAARAVVAEREFDVAHVVGWPLAGIRPALEPLPAVLTTFDAWHLNYAARRDGAARALKPLYASETRRVARFEARKYRSYSSVVVVSEDDAAALHRLDPDIPAVPVPNGVDTVEFSPGDDERDPELVVMTGAMHWPPNVAAARVLVEDVLPRLRERLPKSRVAIVGRSPAEEVTKLARTDRVLVTGEVPSVVGWLRRGGAYACPMVNGTGIKNKLLEAMAAGCACVATPIACQGLTVTSGRELLVAEGADAVAESLAAVLTDRALADRLGAAARDHVIAHHAWESVAAAYEQLLGEAIEAGRAGAASPA